VVLKQELVCGQELVLVRELSWEQLVLAFSLVQELILVQAFLGLVI